MVRRRLDDVDEVGSYGGCRLRRNLKFGLELVLSADWLHSKFHMAARSQMSWSKLLIQQNAKKWLHQMIAN